MSDRQLRYQLRTEGLLLRKRGDSCMIVGGETDFAVAGTIPPLSLSLDEVEEWMTEFSVHSSPPETSSSGADEKQAIAAR